MRNDIDEEADLENGIRIVDKQFEEILVENRDI
jgi:hypothetical protein